MTQEEDVALKEFLEEQLRKGYIRPSISPYACPFFFIKKNGKLRPVQDYRKVDAVAPPLTINDIIPLHK